MTSLKRWTVGLDLSDTDTTILRYVNVLAERFRPDHIFFVHVEEKLAFPAAILDEFPDLDRPSYQLMSKLVKEKVTQYFHAPISYTCEVLEGHPTEELLRWPYLKQTDLIVFGRKPGEKGSGLLPLKVARKAACSVLMVPMGSTPGFQRILVPIDFSPHSALALDTALEVASATPESQVFCTYVFEGAEMYLRHMAPAAVGAENPHTRTEKLEPRLREAAEAQLNSFIQDFKKQGTVIPILEKRTPDSPNLAQHLLKVCDEQQADLVIMGARGQSRTAALLLGSVSEKMLIMNEHIPLLIRRRLHEKQGLLKQWFGKN